MLFTQKTCIETEINIDILWFYHHNSDDPATPHQDYFPEIQD